MRNKSFTKRILAVALSIIMVLGLMPMTAFADGNYTFPSRSQSGDNNSTLRYYLTDENAGEITITEKTNRVELYLDMDEGWYFEKWDTYFNGYEDRAILSDPEVNGSNPVNDEGYYTFYNLNGTLQPFVNLPGTDSRKFIYIAKGTGFYGDHRITAVLKPIVTVDADTGVSYVVTTNNSTTVSTNQTAVKYKDDVKITYTIDNKYVLTSVNASGTKDIAIDKDNGIVTLNDTEKPTSVGIYARLKQQKVNFDANDGSGTMTAQNYSYGEAQELTANSFTKTGYTFAGWNTKADGMGTAYTDKQSVAFTPVNDGDNIILYAQWTECTNHSYENGVCSKCGLDCPHNLKRGEPGPMNDSEGNRWLQITESCELGCGHLATAKLTLSGTSFTYTGHPITPATITYSDNWKGEKELQVFYTNNIDAGYALAGFSAGGSLGFSIEKATANLSIPATAQNSITYGDKLSTAGLPDGWTWADGDPVPTVTSNEFVAYYYPVDTSNYDWTQINGWNKTELRVECTVAVTVNPKAVIITADANSKTFGQKNPALSYVASGLITGETLTGELSREAGENVGTYAIEQGTITDSNNPNYKITYIGADFVIKAANLADATVSVGDVVYTGNALTPAVTVSLNGRTLTKDTDYTVEYFSNVDVGTATVTISGIGNYTGTAQKNFVIDYLNDAPDAIVEGTIGTNGWYISSVELIAPAEFTIAQTLNESYNNSLSYSAEQNENITYYLKNELSGEIAKKTLLLKIDLRAPNGEIKVTENKWTEFWNGITFGLLFNESQDVTITATDSESGIKSVDYYLAGGKLELDEVQLITDWQGYNGTFKINPDNCYVVYAKVTDNAGRIMYVNSDGIVLDSIAPTLEGIEDRKTYYGDLTVIKPNEQFYDIKEVTLDGEPMSFLEGTYGLISADNEEHTVVVEDHTGNKTTYVVTVMKNYTVTYKVNGETLSTETVGHGNNANLPNVPAKDGYTGKWDNDGKNITADTVINANYTKNSAGMPGKSQFPQTGDNSNLWLWFTLLFVSGGCLFGITLNERKKEWQRKDK